MIWANAARCPISAQCGIPGVPRSTYYRMIEHPETERADPIAGDVRAAWRDGRERYGARKIKAAPERRGVTASSRRIGNIMREHEQAAEEGARVPEPLHHDRAAEAQPQRLRVAVRQPAAPLHPRTNTRRAIFSISMSHAVDYTLAVPSSITNRCRAAMDTSDLTAVTLLYIESSFWYFPTSFSKVSGIWHSAPGWDAR